MSVDIVPEERPTQGPAHKPRHKPRVISAWDGDSATGSLSLAYDNDPLTGVGMEDITDPRATRWLDAIYSDADDVILDVPGGKTSALYQTFSAGPEALRDFVTKAGRELVIVTVIGTKKDTLAAVFEIVETFPSGVTHVVVMNGYHGPENSFVIYNGADLAGDGTREFGECRKCADNVGATTLYIPKLSEDTVAILDAKGLTFTNGANAPMQIGRRHSFNVESWLTMVEKTYAGTPIDPRGKAGRKRLILVTNNKGGVGKTFVSQSIIEIGRNPRV